ncbi:hypothetical protein [Anaerobacillus alkaliphilus]|uniref:hypothetical protein n=1 Tax=Anaerobacillus alkaliphilus TaxID=1548597 RepID=UPI0013757C37|nr:hypothetical protein [Anaerobacillus alkaliphilus]
MVYALVGLTIVIYFLIVIRIFHGINDTKTVSFVSKMKKIVKTKLFSTFNTELK